ncbi:MAG TPA: hypothetical protein P5014_01355, partial [Patescibacteria group bacterium]|nr:hypothetical protein [Patescibacteria group bacterium]
VQWNWSQSYGGGCPVMGVTDIYCSNGYGIVQRIADLNLAQDVYHDEVYNLRVNPGDVRSCYIGNVENSELRISETNDSWPNTLEIGDTFTYTIEVRAVGGPVNDVVMINLPPQGFEPVPITFSAVSTDAGHVIDTSGVVYASPGTWDLGNLDEDEVVTITYEAKVTEDVDSGIYPDVSFAQGEGMGGTGLLALSEESGFPINDGVVDENFVGTQVKIAVELELNDEVDVKEEEEGEVLGASTELPATGASTFWVNLVLVLGSIGGLLLLIGGLGTMKKAKKLFMILFAIAGLSYVLNVKANAFSLPQPVVRISEPKSPVGENFNVTFVVLSTDSGQSMTAKCMAINPGSSTPYQFGSDINVTPGGSSYNCEVGESVLDDSGTYKFYVLVDPDSADDVKSDTVEVYYDGIGPDKPKYIEKEKVNDCVNKITLKTADDGETSSVRVYADDDKEIDIDDSHKIETESIGPNEKFDFEHIVSGDSCDKTWYYAVVAFDDAGNASKPRSEVITTTTTTTEEEEEETGAIPVEGGTGLTEGEVAGEGATGPEGTEDEGLEVTLGEGEEGSVLGEETGGEESGKGLFKSPWFWIAAAGLGIVIISATKKKKA